MLTGETETAGVGDTVSGVVTEHPVGQVELGTRTDSQTSQEPHGGPCFTLRAPQGCEVSKERAQICAR